MQGEARRLGHVQTEVHGACSRDGRECKHNAPGVVVLLGVGELDLVHVVHLVDGTSGGPFGAAGRAGEVSDIVRVVAIGECSLEDGSHNSGDDGSEQISNT